MLEFSLRVKPRFRKGAKEQKALLAECYYRTGRINIFLFRLNPTWNKFVGTFNALVNHEMTHYYIFWNQPKGKKYKYKIKERLCELMELNKVFEK